MADPSSGGGGGDSIATFQEEMTKLGGRVRIKSVIGQGSYGTVLKAEEISSGRQFAVKRMHPSILMDRDLSIRVLREVLLLRHFSHPHILSLTHLLVNKEIVTQTEGKSDVMEFLSGEGSLPSVYLTTLLMDTDLRTLLESQQELTNAHVRYLLRQLASGLRAIHKAGVAHRDLTPGNILVNTATCELRIADLGLAREVHEPASAKAGMMTQYVTVRWYRAPEVLVSSTAYGVAVDIWALGCILGELLGSPPLFQGTNTPGQLLKIITVTGTPSTDTLRRLGSSAEIRDYVTRLRHFRCSVPTLAASTFKLHDKAAADLFAALLQFDPAQRLTAAQVLRHPYLTGTSGTAGAAAAEDDDDNETPSISCSSTSDSDSDSSTGDEDILTSDDFDPDAAPVALPPARRGRDGGQPRSGGSGGAKRASAGFGNGLRSGGGRGASNGSFSRVAKFVFDPDRFPTSLSVRTELARLHDEMRGIVVRATARAAVAAAAAAAAIARHARLVACDYTVPVNLRFSQQFAHQHTAPTATKCGTLLPRLFLADTPNMEVCVHLSTSATLHSLHTCVADFLTYELATMRMKAHAALAPAHAAGAAARERRLGSTVRNSFVALSQSMQALSADKAAASALSASASASPQQQHGGGGASTHNTIGNTSSETTPRGTVPAKKPSKISSDDTVDADELQQTPRNPLVVLNEHEEGTAAQQQAAAAAAAAAASLNRSAPERSLSPERHPQPNSLARTHGSTFGGIASRQPTPRGSQHRAPSPGSAPAPSPPCASGGGGGGDPAWGAKKRQRAGDRAPAALDASLLERDDDADATPPPPPPPPPPRHADAAAEQANPFDDGAPAAGDLDAFYTELRAPRRTDALAQRLRDGFGLKAKHLLQLFGPACLVAAPAPASFKDPRSRERVTLGCSASLRGLVYCVEPAAAAAATMPPHAVAADFPPPGGRVHLVREVLVDSCRVAKPSSKGGGGGGGGGGGRSYGGRHLRFVFPELHKAVTVPDKAVRAALAVVASSGVACNAAPPAAGPPPPVPPIAKSVVVCGGGGGGGRAGLQLSSEATAELRQAERRKAMASRDMRVSASHAALDSLMLHLQSSPRNRSGGGGGGGGGPPGDATPTSGTPRARHVRSSSQTVSMAHGTPLGGAASGRLPAGHADPHDLPQMPQPAAFSPTRPLACPATRTPHQRTPSSIVAGPATDVIPADTLLSSLRKTEASLNLGASANGGVGPPLDDASNAPLLYTCLLNVRCYVWGRFDPAASRFPGGGGGGGGGHSRVASFDAPSPAPRLRSPRGAGAGGGAAAASAAQSRRHTVPVIDGIAGVKSAFGATGQQAASAQASAAVAATDSARQLNMNDSESDSDSIDFVPATAAAATRAAAAPPTNGKTPNGDAAKKQGHHPPRGVQQQQQAAPTAATATATAPAGGGGGGPPGWGTGRGAPLQQAAAAGRGAAERPQHNPVAPPPSQQQQPPGAAGRGTPAAGGVGGGGPLARKTSSAVVSKRASGTFAAAAAATAPAQRDPFSIPGDDEAEGGGGSASQRRRRRRSRATTAAGGTDTSQSDVTSVNNSDDSDGDPDGCCRCECVVA